MNSCVCDTSSPQNRTMCFGINHSQTERTLKMISLSIKYYSKATERLRLSHNTTDFIFTFFTGVNRWFLSLNPLVQLLLYLSPLLLCLYLILSVSAFLCSHWSSSGWLFDPLTAGQGHSGEKPCLLCHLLVGAPVEQVSFINRPYATSLKREREKNNTNTEFRHESNTQLLCFNGNNENVLMFSHIQTNASKPTERRVLHSARRPS